MDVTSSISEIDLKIIDFANSKVLLSLTGRNQLIEFTIVTILVNYLCPYQFEDKLKRMLKTSDYDSITLITEQETKDFCIDYFTLIDDWLDCIKFRKEDFPNLHRITTTYNLDELINAYE